MPGHQRVLRRQRRLWVRGRWHRGLRARIRVPLQMAMVRGGANRPDFYVTSDGTAVPATGYRGFGGDQNLAEATYGVIASRNPTYFTFNNISGMTGQQVQDLLQLPQTPTHGVSFDTLQLLPDLSIPGGRWNTLSTPEPFTSTYPEWGTGGEHAGHPN